MRLSAMEYAVRFIRVMRISDIIDILIIAVAVYYFMMAIRGTRAVQLVRGILVAAVIYFLSGILHLDGLNYILSAIVQVAVFAIIVIFQPELRNILEHMGRFKILKILGIPLNDSVGDIEDVAANISLAAADMASTKTGALIVIERGTRLGEYMNSGTMLDADVSSELLKNIFVPNTPLHDGAVIIRGNKIITAGCVLPLTANTNLSSELGTRHRAALGLSEASDAIIVVVSEETGKISIALNGSLTRNLTAGSLEKALMKLLETNTEPNSRDTLKKIQFWKSK
ncbi:MAG: diadenylate cyclase CdaA [Oscillospiraceae bacterium]|nr:diadenylate cyclase CdaA [Oscillospiraceae bacterium]